MELNIDFCAQLNSTGIGQICDPLVMSLSRNARPRPFVTVLVEKSQANPGIYMYQGKKLFLEKTPYK